MSKKINYDITVYCIYTVIHIAGINTFKCSYCLDNLSCYVMLVQGIDIQSWDMFIETPVCHLFTTDFCNFLTILDIAFQLHFMHFKSKKYLFIELYKSLKIVFPSVTPPLNYPGEFHSQQTIRIGK